MNWQEDDLPLYDPTEEESKPIRLYNEDDEDFDESFLNKEEEDYDWTELADFDGYGDYD